MNGIRLLRGSLLIGLILWVLPFEARAQSGGSYNLAWNTVSGGGGTFSTGGNYSLGGSAGQPNAGPANGGSYALSGGFWPGGAAGIVSGVPPVDAASSLARLYPNSPNPFTQKTMISFDLSQQVIVQASVFNVSGELVRRLVLDQLPAGSHELSWDGFDDFGHMLPHGIYFLGFRAGTFSSTQKLIFAR